MIVHAPERKTDGDRRVSIPIVIAIITHVKYAHPAAAAYTTCCLSAPAVARATCATVECNRVKTSDVCNARGPRERAWNRVLPENITRRGL